MKSMNDQYFIALSSKGIGQPYLVPDENTANYKLATGFLELVSELLAFYDANAPEKIPAIIDRVVQVGRYYRDSDDFYDFFSESGVEADREFTRVMNSEGHIKWEPSYVHELEIAMDYYQDILDLAEMVYREYKDLEKNRATSQEEFEFLEKWGELVISYYKLEESIPVKYSNKLIYANLKNLLNAFLIAAFDTGNIKAGVEFADKIQDISHINNYLYHRAACLYVANEEYDKVLKQCRLAKEQGYPHMDSLKTDTDLQELFERKEFQEL